MDILKRSFSTSEETGDCSGAYLREFVFSRWRHLFLTKEDTMMLIAKTN
jgi:hypothetical protein